MSVSHELKNEIISQQYKSACCRRSMLSGILFAKGIADGKEIVISLEKREFAEFTAELISEFYGKEPRIFRSPNGGRQIFVGFKSSSASKYIENFADFTSESTVCDLIMQKCSNCLSAFLRGVFLAAGTLADPQKSFSLDFSLRDRSHMFSKILSDLSMTPRIGRRKSGEILYFRSSHEIEDFFAYAGINHAVFGIIEVEIARNARAVSSRYMNCVMSNYNRMSEVASRQLSIVHRLDELNLLSSLPDELERTARMRMQNPDLPLSKLAAIMTPAISKSGLSHRLKQIEEIGARLLKINEDV